MAATTAVAAHSGATAHHPGADNLTPETRVRGGVGSGQRALGVWLGVALVLAGVLLASSEPAPPSAHVPAHIGATSAGDAEMLAAASRRAKQQRAPTKKQPAPPRKRSLAKRRTPPSVVELPSPPPRVETVDPLVDSVLARGGSTSAPRPKRPKISPAPPEVPAKPFAQCGRPRCTRPATVLQNPVMLLYRPANADGTSNDTCVADDADNDTAGAGQRRRRRPSPTALTPCPTPESMESVFGEEYKTRRCFRRGREDGFGFRRSTTTKNNDATTGAREETKVHEGSPPPPPPPPEWVQRRMRPNRARRGIECKRRGAIIGFAAGYEFRLLTHFPASFATVASPCDELIIIVSETKPLDLWAPHAAASDNVRIVPYEEVLRQAPEPELRYNVTGLKPEGFRVLVMHAMLESHPAFTDGSYDYLVTLDTRDLVFHGDPFAFARGNGLDGLFLTREVHSYAHVDGFNFNRWWVEKVIPKAAEKHIASLSFELLREDADDIQLPVLCSGIYGGTATAFRDFMRLFACEYAALRPDRPDALGVGGVDQGVFIATLIYTVRAAAFPHPIYVLDEQAGPFRHWPYPEETLALNAETRLINCHGAPYAVVHQADRYNHLHWATLRGFPGDRFRHSTYPACGSVVAAGATGADLRPVNFTEHAVELPEGGGMPFEWLKAPDGAREFERIRPHPSAGTLDDASPVYTCSAYSVVGAYLLPLDVALDAIPLKTAERHKAIATHVGLLLRSFATLHTARCERLMLFTSSVPVAEAVERLVDGADGPPTVPSGQPAPDAADRARRWADVLVPRRGHNGTATGAGAANVGADAWTWPLPTAAASTAAFSTDPAAAEPAPAEWLVPLLRVNASRGATGAGFVATAEAALRHTAAAATKSGALPGQAPATGTVAAVALGLGRTTGLFLRNVFAATDDAVARLPAPAPAAVMFLTFSNHSSAFFAAVPPPRTPTSDVPPPSVVVADAARFGVASALPENTTDDMPRGYYPAGCSSGSFEAANAALLRHGAGADKKMLVRPEGGPEPMLALLLDRVGAVGFPTALEHATYSYEPFHTPSPVSTELNRCPTPGEVLALLATTTPAPTKEKTS